MEGRMRRNATAFTMIIFVIFLQVTAIEAIGFDLVVKGTDDPKKDVSAVQQAVEQGGSILLKGTFNFGEKGKIEIINDVAIHGEKDAEGGATTKIVGGLWSFHSPLPKDLPPTGKAPKITIQNIHFEGALWAPISLPYCSGADIRSVKVTNVKPIDNKTPYFGKEGIHRQQGIIFYPPYTLPKEYGEYQPGLITGNIIIADNFIDLINPIPEKTVAQGILVVGGTGANIQILRNRVLNSSRNAIEVIDNYPGPDGEGLVLIQGNEIMAPDKGLSLPSPSTPNGIVAGWFINLASASDQALGKRIIVTGNKIETRGASSLGIIVISDGPTIASNVIQLNGGEKARGILHYNSHATITNNKIIGLGSAGIILTPWKSFKANKNTLIDNEFPNFNAVEANVILKGSDNIVIGECGKIMDSGKTNLILK
jgi:hypothetical protein